MRLVWGLVDVSEAAEVPTNEDEKARLSACVRGLDRNIEVSLTWPTASSNAGIRNSTEEIQAATAHRITGLTLDQLLLFETHAK